MKLLLTGAPRSGKSTLVRRLVDGFPGNAGGMMVAELLGPDGRRCGFEVQVVWQSAGGGLRVVDRQVLAEAAPAPGARVGRYALRPEALTLAVQALDAAMHEGGLVIVDEVGPLQITSPAFRDAVLRCLDGPTSLLATVAQSEDPFLALLKARPGVRVMEVTRQNRGHLAEGLQPWLRGEHRI
ncbi:MAG TPA: nucleoside-triphosphatase [Symbiobacteriaceae bacterium]|nr:nucleoside-triphosphatase [Symbiobacteriaceae bacterium]